MLGMIQMDVKWVMIAYILVYLHSDILCFYLRIQNLLTKYGRISNPIYNIQFPIIHLNLAGSVV